MENETRNELSLRPPARLRVVLAWSALFALEILHRKGLQYHEALLPAVLASLLGYGVYVAASGLGLTPVWNFHMGTEPVLSCLLWAIGAGLLGGGVALGHAIHALVPSTNEAVLACAIMAAANTGVTKTPLGSTLVVSKRVGPALIPSTAVAAVVALLVTHRSGLFTSQRERVDAV